MYWRAGALRVLFGLRAPARVRVCRLRRAGVAVGLIGMCCLFGGSTARAALPPAFTVVSGSPFATGGSPSSVAFAPGGGLLAVTNVDDNTLSVFSVAVGGGLSQVSGSPFATGGSPSSVAFAPGGGLLAVTNVDDNTVSVFSVAVGGGLSEVSGSPFATGGSPSSVAFAPDGGLLAVTNGDDNTVSVFSVAVGWSAERGFGFSVRDGR